MFRFEHREYLILLLLLPVMAAVFIIVSYIKRRKLKKIGNSSLIRELMPDVSAFRYNLKFLLFIAAVAFLMLAIAGPQFGTILSDVKQSGVEVIIALDVSNSMRAEDIKPSRLEKAKLDLSRLMDRLSDTRAGLIVFAGNAYTQYQSLAISIQQRHFYQE
jgi:Ca-activated chloride channel family protein